MNTRRRRVIVLGLGALLVPFRSFAQQQNKVWRVGFLAFSSRANKGDAEAYAAFGQGMRELGYVEGKDLVIEWRFADGKPEQFPRFAAELVQLKVDAIVVGSFPATFAAQKATSTIPIIMTSNPDPVDAGLVKSLARPGGNITGLTSISADLSAKHLELLIDLFPKLSQAAVLSNPDNPSHMAALKNVQSVARTHGVSILSVEARTPQEIESAFTAIAQRKASVIVGRDPMFNRQAPQIAALALKHRLPVISAIREYVYAGGLMSYGANRADLMKRVAFYVDKIFKGAKPAEIPIEQPARFELVINMKTAKALGIKIPNSILLRADKVIE